MSIPNNANTAVRSSTLRTENMRIDSESLVHLMSTLSSLYSNIPLALLRELSTNAYDAQVAAGKGHLPITVKLPDYADTFLEVSDEGVGLTEEEIFGIYGVYGASTKRDSNAFTGQLGLGCKSPFSYTSSFTVVSTKNGVRSTYSIHKDGKGVPSISLLDQVNTDAPNGVKVRIPVKTTDIGKFREEALHLFRWWDIIPNGISVDPVPGLVELAPKLFLSVGLAVHYAYVVMGNVPYPIPNEKHRFVYYAEMGEVDFTPSRESLQMTKRTQAKLDEIREAVTEGAIRFLRSQLDESKSYPEAITKFYRGDTWYIRQAAGKYQFKYKEEVLPSYIMGRFAYPGNSVSEAKFTGDRHSKMFFYSEDVPKDKWNSYLFGKARAYAEAKNVAIFIPYTPMDVSGAKNVLTKEEIYKAVPNQRKAAGDRILNYRLNIIPAGKDKLPEVFVSTSDLARYKSLGMSVLPEGLTAVQYVTDRQAKSMKTKPLFTWLAEKGDEYIANSNESEQIALLRAQNIYLPEDMRDITPVLPRTHGGSEELKLLRRYINIYQSTASQLSYGHPARICARLVHKGFDELTEKMLTALNDAIKAVRKDYPLLFVDTQTTQNYIDGKEE